MDVAKAGIDPLVHYLEFGVQEKRNPSASFDTKYYLDSNPDVRRAGLNPLVHYCLYGQSEGRSPSPYHSNNHTVDKTEEALGKAITIDEIFHEAKTIIFPSVSEPDVSIIVPVFNKIEYTLRCLRALSCQESALTFEVILADDHSMDETPEVAELITGLICVRNTKNLGFLLNCNKAAKAAKGKYIVFLNNDTTPFTNWLSELLAPLVRDKKVGLTGSMLLYSDGTLQEAGGFIFEDASGWNYGRNGDPDDCRYSFVREVDYCSGASIAISKELWTQLGGFDEYYEPAYYEDTDLAFRIRSLGYKVVYTPFSKTVHFEGISSGTDLSSGVKKYQSVNRPKFQQRWQHELSLRPKPKSANFSVWKPYKKRALLWIDALTPTPDKDSGSVDAFNFLKTAHENGWGVSFIPFFNQNHAASYTESLQRLGIQCWYQPYLKSLRHYLEVHGPELDIVVLSRITVASKVIDDVKRYAPQAKIIFNTVDLHFLRQARKNVIVKKHTQHDGSDVDSLRKQELGMIERADLTILISPKEEAIVKELLPSAKTSVIPIIRNIPGRKAGFYDRRDICFLGGFLHPPNQDAVQYFLNNIWSLVKQKLPDCRFVIAGSNMPDNIKALASEDIVVKGFVPDLSTLFETVRLSIVPLRYGAGMKGKIVSSLSFGVPVIATSVAVEGMNLKSGYDIAVADTPEAIADELYRVYTAVEAWESLSNRGLARAREQFSFEAVAPQILKTINNVVV